MKALSSTVQRWRRYRAIKTSLQAQLRREVEALNTGEHLDAEELERRAKRIRDVNELIQATRTISPIQKAERTAVVGAVLVALLVTTFLVFKSLKSTDVELTLVLSEVSFQLAQESPVLQPVTVADLQILDVMQIVVPGSTETDLNSSEGITARLRGATKENKDSPRVGQITLPGLVLPKGTIFSIKQMGHDTFRLVITRPAGDDAVVPLDMTGKGPVEITIAGETAKSAIIDLDSVYVIRVVPLTKDVTMDLSLQPNTGLNLLPQIPVSDVSFVQTDSEAAARGVSAIRSGGLTLMEVGSQNIALRPFEHLALQSINWDQRKNGLRLRSLILSKDGIEVKFYGAVSSMRTGQTGAERDLMPSQLEWINSNHRIKLLWTGIVFVAGMIFGVIHWLSKSK